VQARRLENLLDVLLHPLHVGHSGAHNCFAPLGWRSRFKLGSPHGVCHACLECFWECELQEARMSAGGRSVMSTENLSLRRFQFFWKR